MTILDNNLSRRNLLVFLSQLERVHLSWMAPTQVEGQEESKDSHGSFNDKGEFMVSEAESKRLQKKFEPLRAKRRIYVKNYKQARADQYTSKDPNEYKPKIDKRSKELAEKRLKKELGEEGDES